MNRHWIVTGPILAIGGAKVGDLISYAEGASWKHKIVMGLVTKVNKVSVTAVNPQNGESTTVKTNKYVVVSKRNEQVVQNVL